MFFVNHLEMKPCLGEAVQHEIGKAAYDPNTLGKIALRGIRSLRHLIEQMHIAVSICVHEVPYGGIPIGEVFSR